MANSPTTSRLSALPRRPTQQDLAKVLKLSRRAVSEALREQGGTVKVSEKTRARVREVAEKLGYRHNLIARALRTGKTGKLGILNFQGGQDSLSARRLYYAIQAAEKRGEVPIVYHADSRSEQASLDGCHAMIDSKVDAVLLLSPSRLTFHQKNVALLQEAGIFVASLSSGWLKGMSCYIHDKKDGFERLTRHLVEEEYRSITLVAWDLPLKTENSKGARYSHAREALSGFRNVAEACKKSGKPVRFDVHSVSRATFTQLMPILADIHPLHVAGYVTMREMIEQGGLPEALMFQVDNWALGALRACGEAGIAVPGDIAITGFENDPSSSAGYPPLTSIAHPVEELCRMAVDELIANIQGQPETPKRTIRVSGELIVRQSSVRRPLPKPDLSTLSFI